MKNVLYLLICFLLLSCNQPAFLYHKTPTVDDSNNPQVAKTDQKASGDLLPPIINKSAIPSIKFLYRWQPSSMIYSGPDAHLPNEIGKIMNGSVISGLTDTQKNMLLENGFVVLHTQEDGFTNIRKKLNDIGQPYYLSTDAGLDAFESSYDRTIQELERVELYPRISSITANTLTEVLSLLDQTKGTTLEADTKLAIVYLYVANNLFNPQASIDPRFTDVVSAQLRQVWEASGYEQSVMNPDYSDNFGNFKPNKHYKNNPELEAYYRGMTWLDRDQFRIHDPGNRDFIPSRAPLIITYALRKANHDGKPVAEEWTDLFGIISYILGSPRGLSPIEYSLLMDQVYGSGMKVSDLENEEKAREFFNILSELTTDRDIPILDHDLQNNGQSSAWHFIGQPNGLDGQILKALLFDKSGTPNTQRTIPSGLDIPAVLGSEQALVETTSKTKDAGYLDQVNSIKEYFDGIKDADWFTNLPMIRLYTYRQLLQRKEQVFPPYMQTRGWQYKDLNTSLGGWIESNIDSPKIITDDEPKKVPSGKLTPTPAQVEPNPDFFYNLSFLSKSIVDDLALYNIIPEAGKHPKGLDNYLFEMRILGEQYKKLGDIASKELTGRPLTEDDYWTIQGCLGSNDCSMNETVSSENIIKYHRLPAITSFPSLNGKDIFEAGLGKVDRIFVVVNIQGHLEIAQGGVYSYYEFSHAGPYALSDVEWQNQIATTPPPNPGWYENLRPEEKGSLSDIVAFRMGDRLKVKTGSDGLNVRKNPILQGELIRTIYHGTIFEIIEGPSFADGYKWWKIQIQKDGAEGWIAENLEWIESAE